MSNSTYFPPYQILISRHEEAVGQEVPADRRQRQLHRLGDHRHAGRKRNWQNHLHQGTISFPRNNGDGEVGSWRQGQIMHQVRQEANVTVPQQAGGLDFLPIYASTSFRYIIICGLNGSKTFINTQCTISNHFL